MTIRSRQRKTSYYKQCSKCGSNLDPGEVCNCETAPHAVRARETAAYDVYAEWGHPRNKMRQRFTQSA